MTNPIKSLLQGLVKKHPDIRLEQLINFLLCRGDVSRSEARQIVLDTLGEDTAMKPRDKGVFAEIAAEMTK